MIAAIELDFLDPYFECIVQVLKFDGRVVIQVIVISRRQIQVTSKEYLHLNP